LFGLRGTKLIRQVAIHRAYKSYCCLSI
jgi:hypothetical protein